MGWNGSDGSAVQPIKKKRAPSAMRGIVTGLVVAVLASAGLFFILSSDEETRRPAKNNKARQIEEKKERSEGIGGQETAHVANTARETHHPTTDSATGRRTSQVSEGSGEHQEVPTPQKETAPKKPPVFSNASDQLLAMAVGGEPGVDIPPLPVGPGVEKDFMESLKRQIIINDDDPEDVKEIKRRVMEAREGLIEHVAKGGSVESALKEHEEVTRENNKVRNEIAAEYHELLAGGDAEGAKEYLETMNKAISQMGIEPIRERRPRRPRGQQTTTSTQGE